MIIQTACPSEEEATRISRILLEKKLVAGAQISEVQSLYWWEGKMHEKKEWSVNFLTRIHLFEEIRDIIFAEHSYDLPEVVALPIRKTVDRYSEWIIRYTS